MPGAHGPVVELRSDRGTDPDASHLKAILAAHLDAQHAHVFCQLLWRRLGIVAGIATTVEVITRLASAGVLAIVLAVLCGTSLVGPLVEWRAERRFMRLLNENAHAATLR